eukprot:gene341-3708_t
MDSNSAAKGAALFRKLSKRRQKNKIQDHSSDTIIHESDVSASQIIQPLQEPHVQESSLPQKTVTINYSSNTSNDSSEGRQATINTLHASQNQSPVTHNSITSPYTKTQTLREPCLSQDTYNQYSISENTNDGCTGRNTPINKQNDVSESVDISEAFPYVQSLASVSNDLHEIVAIAEKKLKEKDEVIEKLQEQIRNVRQEQAAQENKRQCANADPNNKISALQEQLQKVETYTSVTIHGLTQERDNLRHQLSNLSKQENKDEVNEAFNLKHQNDQQQEKIKLLTDEVKAFQQKIKEKDKELLNMSLSENEQSVRLQKLEDERNELALRVREMEASASAS